MSGPDLYGQALVRLVNRIVDQRLADGFGGSPGVYRNVHLTVDRTGRVKFAHGGGEVAFDFAGTPGTIHYAVPYQMEFGSAVTTASGGSASVYYAAPDTTMFEAMVFPFRAMPRGTVRVVALGLTASDWVAVTLVRNAPNGTVTNGVAP